MFDSNGLRKGRGLLLSAICCAALLLAGCGGGGGENLIGGEFGGAAPTGVNQAGYAGGTSYVFGHNSIPNVPITGVPADTDFSRWAMLHDGTTYRMYFFKKDSMSIYQFGFNGSSYDFGYSSIPEIAITGMPAEADASSFKMLHDGADYRLYMRGISDPTKLYQAAFNRTTGAYEYGYRSIDVIGMTGAPADVDLSRWAMLYDGSVYRQYAGRIGTTDVIYQFGFNGSSYAFGYRSIAELDIIGMPTNSETGSFSMVHDGTDYRFYHLSLPE